MQNFILSKIKKHLFFFILIPTVIISQVYLLKPHLHYGFIDLDDGYITEFKFLREKYLDGKLLSGFSFEDKKYMRQLLLPYYQNLSADNPRLIYLDMEDDQHNKSFYLTSIYSGSADWPLWLKNINF